jgi:RNase P/RNase MRP subunit POP5
MTVKDKVGRKRYITFKLESPRELSRGELIYTFNKRPSKPYLIILEEKGGIVRCLHKKLDDTVKELNGIHKLKDVEVKIETIKVAGSIKKAKKILGNV